MTDDEAVAGTDTPEGAKVEPDAPEKSYDELLDEFNTTPEPVPEPTPTDQTQQIAALEAKLDKLGDQVSSNTQAEAFTKTLGKFRESDTLKHLSDRSIKGWINERCREDPRITEAYGTPS